MENVNETTYYKFCKLLDLAMKAGIGIEFSKDEAHTSRNTDFLEWEFKTFTDENPLEKDGNLNAGINYLEEIVKVKVPTDLNEIYHIETTKYEETE